MKHKRTKIRILHPFLNISKREWLFYLALLLVSMVAAMIVYSRSCAFYSTDCMYDVIYTSDSPSLMDWNGSNAFLALSHPENDLKQPLFAVFSAPLMILPYLLGRLFCLFSTRLWFCPALFMDWVQILLILCANLLLAEMLELSPVKRVCFMAVLCFSYTYMLFVLIIEQYAVSYFWLILFLYLLRKKQADRCIALHGAGGTLVSSLAAAPWASRFCPYGSLRRWFGDMLRHLAVFVLLVFVFRSDLFSSVSERLMILSGFTGTGGNVSVWERICRFTVFLRGLFFAPAAGPAMRSYYVSWQLSETLKPDWLGMLVLILAAVGFVVGREERAIRISGLWALYAVFILGIVGLGAAENGMILYSLYFGWSFGVLVFRLLEEAEIRIRRLSGEAVKLDKRTHRETVFPVAAAMAALFSALINFPALLEMVRFAARNYPA